MVRWLACLKIVGIFIFGANSATVYALVANPLDQKLQSYLDRLNTRRPTMVAPTLRQEKSTVFNGVMTNIYTEVTKTAYELAPMNLSATQRPFIFPAICKTNDTGRMLREGYSFRYLYYGKDGNLAGQLIITPADCAGAQ